MKTHEPDKKEPSRREFAKAVAATLLTVHLIPSSVDAQRRTRRNPHKDRLKLLPLPRMHGFTAGPGGIDDHIPPIGLLDGSLELNNFDEFNPRDGETISHPIGNRKWRYKQPNFGKIKKVRILVTNEVDFSTYKCTYGPGCNNIELRIWLQERRHGTDEYEPIPAGALPDVLISHDATGTFLQVETPEKFDHKKTKHPHRPHKYQIEEKDTAEHFRIGRVRVVSSNCDPCFWETRDFDRYLILVYGPDIDPH